ncbi:Crp/Fnr family transcriptional regulator [Ilumatobacter nonamiensis]|uniref:Crp/Fnr family transcriptional regulator n=1 Tax=Ilumatobacter nonamiensis TaxID=467093 RepID=UPI00058B6CFA|nr:Crp/Fnr family transcriptional regulator [Ilumatobacter nonamiensis]
MEWEILSSLDDRQRTAVLQTAVRRKFRAGDTLFHQGDPGDTVHLLERGHVAVKVVHVHGVTLTLHVLGPGSAFGEQTLVDPRARRTASVVAIGPVETLMIRRDDFIELQKRHPAVTTMLVEILAAQVRRLSEQLLDAHSMGAEQRVVKRLVLLAEDFRVGDAATLPITQEELASLAGTTRPTANRALQALVDDGAVQLARGRIHIPDLERLPTV